LEEEEGENQPTNAHSAGKMAFKPVCRVCLDFYVCLFGVDGAKVSMPDEAYQQSLGPR